ncbi:MAG TPA: Hpt domain-containing protein [Thermoanaerobaculia bacterium]|jgi:HPt (histidine-containing phosphotransfer) domain-containing protein
MIPPPHILRAKFTVSLHRRVSELQEMLDQNDLVAAERAFHSLAGIGGTYGFPEVTTLARMAEHLCTAGGRDQIDEIFANLWDMAASLREAA